MSRRVIALSVLIGFLVGLGVGVPIGYYLTERIVVVPFTEGKSL